MNARKYFPLGKAYGVAFCNRTEETRLLVGNIQSGKHTFLVAPRRYGKSSLCEKAIEQAKLPTTRIDLHVATSEKGIERAILKGVIDLIGKSVGTVDKTIQSIKHLFKNLKPKLSIEVSGFQLEFDVAEDASSPEVIREALIILEKLLKNKNQRAVMLIDEFQRVIEIAPDMGIEGGIRSAAQETEYLSMIFSGSSRHLIESIFHDEGRPLYKLCKKIRLERISAEHYHDHLNTAAQLSWQQNLPEEVFAGIMQLSERHPYYVNYICDALWSTVTSLPNSQEVQNVWDIVVNEERSDLLNEFYSLTENQKRLLIYLAGGNTTNIYSAEASKKMGIPSTSIPKAIYALLEKNLIEEIDKAQYHVINPAYKAILV